MSISSLARRRHLRPQDCARGTPGCACATGSFAARGRRPRRSLPPFQQDSVPKFWIPSPSKRKIIRSSGLHTRLGVAAQGAQAAAAPRGQGLHTAPHARPQKVRWRAAGGRGSRGRAAHRRRHHAGTRPGWANRGVHTQMGCARREVGVCRCRAALHSQRGVVSCCQAARRNNTTATVSSERRYIRQIGLSALLSVLQHLGRSYWYKAALWVQAAPAAAAPAARVWQRRKPPPKKLLARPTSSAAPRRCPGSSPAASGSLCNHGKGGGADT